MNIFEIYLKKINIILIDLNKKGLIELPKNKNSFNVEIPPVKFDSDISTNVAMVLSKINQKSPIEIAEIIETKIKDDSSV